MSGSHEVAAAHRPMHGLEPRLGGAEELPNGGRLAKMHNRIYTGWAAMVAPQRAYKHDVLSGVA